MMIGGLGIDGLRIDDWAAALPNLQSVDPQSPNRQPSIGNLQSAIGN
jgi:hypothetical protein